MQKIIQNSQKCLDCHQNGVNIWLGYVQPIPKISLASVHYLFDLSRAQRNTQSHRWI